MKPALYYAVRVKTLYPYVVAVTSEKPTRRGERRWFGRDCRYETATHGTSDQLRGRYPDQATAEGLVKQIKAIAERYDAERKLLSQHITSLYRAEQDEVDGLFTKQEEGNDQAT